MIQKPPFIPYGKSVHGEEEIEAVVNVLRSSTQMGKHVFEMEQEIAKLFQKKYGIMVNSGSSANYLAIEIINLPHGSEVITPVLSFSTTVAPLIKNQLVPIFIDVEANTFNIDVNQVENSITPNTRALMIPNLLGNLPNWSQLKEIADKYNLIIIEDSADTLGARINDVSTGYYSDISTTSFYGSHVINCAGNGGMLCVNDEKLAEKAKLLRSWGRSSSLFVESEAIENRFNVDVDGIPYDAKFVFEAVGYNLEPSELGAAFGLVQLKKLAQNIHIRENAFKYHLAYFRKYEEYFILPKQLEDSKTGWLAFPLIIRENAPFVRRDLQIYLEKNGIQTRTIFTGNILRQPGFISLAKQYSDRNFPNADLVMKGGMLLGCHHGLSIDMIDYIHQCVDSFLALYEQSNVANS